MGGRRRGGGGGGGSVWEGAIRRLGWTSSYHSESDRMATEEGWSRPLFCRGLGLDSKARKVTMFLEN